MLLWGHGKRSRVFQRRIGATWQMIWDADMGPGNTSTSTAALDIFTSPIIRLNITFLLNLQLASSLDLSPREQSCCLSQSKSGKKEPKQKKRPVWHYFNIVVQQNVSFKIHPRCHNTSQETKVGTVKKGYLKYNHHHLRCRRWKLEAWNTEGEG